MDSFKMLRGGVAVCRTGSETEILVKNEVVARFYSSEPNDAELVARKIAHEKVLEGMGSWAKSTCL